MFLLPSPAQETVLSNRCSEHNSSLYDLYSGDTLKVDTHIIHSVYIQITTHRLLALN